LIVQTETTITFSKAIEIRKENIAKRKIERLHYYREFKDSYCDLFDLADFEFYAEMTGLKLSTIFQLAKYSDTNAYCENVDGEMLMFNTDSVILL